MIRKTITFVTKYGVTGSIIFLLGLAGVGVSYGIIHTYTFLKGLLYDRAST